LNAKHEPSLIGPEGGVDAGYIPPSGRDVKFTIRNPTNRPVVITHVEKSCGCTEVNIPNVVEPQAEVRGTIRIIGDRFPARRHVSIILNTDSEPLIIPVTYGTGDIPCVQPPHTQFVWVDNELVATTNLWLQGSKGASFIFGHSDFDTKVNPTSEFTWDSKTRSVILRGDGICRVPIRLCLTETIANGSGRIEYECGGVRHVVNVPYTIAESDSVALTPSVTHLYVESGRREVETRVFSATAYFSFVPEVVSAPEYCHPRLERISDRQWKLVVSFDPILLPVGTTRCEIRLQSLQERHDRVISNSCVVHVDRKE
jgi:hypothetical protein